MLEVRKGSSGWAVWAIIEDQKFRLTKYTRTKAESEIYMEKIIKDKEERDRRWEEQLQAHRDIEARAEAWIKGLEKYGNVRRIKDPTYFDKKQMDLLKAQDRKKLEQMLMGDDENESN